MVVKLKIPTYKVSAAKKRRKRRKSRKKKKTKKKRKSRKTKNNNRHGGMKVSRSTLKRSQQHGGVVVLPAMFRGHYETSFGPITLGASGGEYKSVGGKLVFTAWNNDSLTGTFTNPKLKLTGDFEFKWTNAQQFTGKWRWTDEPNWQRTSWNGNERVENVIETKDIAVNDTSHVTPSADPQDALLHKCLEQLKKYPRAFTNAAAEKKKFDEEEAAWRNTNEYEEGWSHPLRQYD